MAATPACRHKHLDRDLQSDIFIQSIKIQIDCEFHKLGRKPPAKKDNTKHKKTRSQLLHNICSKA